MSHVVPSGFPEMTDVSESKWFQDQSPWSQPWSPAHNLFVWMEGTPRHPVTSSLQPIRHKEIQKPQSQGFAEALRHGPGQHVFNAFGEGTQSRKEDMRVVIIVWGPPLFPRRGGSGSGYHIL